MRTHFHGGNDHWLWEGSVLGYSGMERRPTELPCAVEQAIRNALEPVLRDQGLESLQVIPGVDANVLIQSTPAVRRALWAIGERRYPHLRYGFHDDQRLMDTGRG